MAEENKELKQPTIAEQRTHNQLMDALGDMDQKSGDYSPVGGSMGSTGMWREEIAAYLDNQNLKNLFFSEDWVFIVVDLIANKISSQALRVMRETVQQGTSAYEPNDGHPLNAVFENPNPWQDYHSWMYNYIVELILMGNGINWYAKQSKQLLTLQAEKVNMGFNSKGVLSYYEVSQTSCDGIYEQDKVVRFRADDIIHTRRPNPCSRYWGLSPFIPGRKSVLFNRYSTDYLNAFYLRQATPGLALKLDKQVNEDVALRQLRTFELAYTGRKNQRRTLILPKGVDATPLTHSLSDQKLADMIGINRETIINLFKIPKHELGIQKVGSLGSEEHRLALRNFWEATLIPTMALVEGNLTKFFADELGKGNFIKFDIGDVDALQEDKLTKAELAKELLESGWSVNEVRRNLFAMEAADGDDADRPYNLVRLDRHTAGMAPQDSSTEPDEPPPEGDEVDAKYMAWHNMTQKQLDLELEGKVGKIASQTLDMYSELATVVVDILAGELKGSPSYDTKQTGLAEAIEEKIDDEEIGGAWIAGLLLELLPTVELGYDQALEVIQDLPEFTEITELRNATLDDRRALLEDRLKQAFRQVAKTAVSDALKEVEGKVEEGATPGDILGGILVFFAGEKMTGRAGVVAQTEVLTAASLGNYQAAIDAGSKIPGMKKMWITKDDDRVRGPGSVWGWQPGKPNHRVLNGKVLPLSVKFGNGLRFPRDPKSNVAGEVINCRCSLVMIPPA